MRKRKKKIRGSCVVTGADARAFRESLGMSLKTLSGIVGVSGVSLWRLEKRKVCSRRGPMGWLVDLVYAARGCAFTPDQQEQLADPASGDYLSHRIRFIADVTFVAVGGDPAARRQK